jgi:MSHA pilin protein MshC
MHLTRKQRKTGFTLIELLIVLIGLGILSVFAVQKGTSVPEATLPSQAQTLASDIRHAQTLAYTSGTPVRFRSTSSTSYAYGACASASPAACGTSCTEFVVPLQKGVTLSVSPNATWYFNTLGQPLNNTCGSQTNKTRFTLTSGSTVTVSVAALTGIVNVCPPDPAVNCQ